VTLDGADVLGQGADVHLLRVVKCAHLVDEAMHAGEEGVVVARYEPLLLLGVFVCVKRRHQRQVADSHLDGRVRVVDVDVDAHIAEEVGNLLKLTVAGIEEHEQQLATIRVAATVGQPEDPLVDGRRGTVHEAVVGG